jgi:hypothetical protein
MQSGKIKVRNDWGSKNEPNKWDSLIQNYINSLKDKTMTP